MHKQGKRLQLDFLKQSPRKFQNLTNHTQESELQSDQYGLVQTRFENSMQMNIKEHVDQLFNILKSIKDDLKLSRDDMNIIKNDLQKMKSNQCRDEDRFTKALLQDLNKQKNELKKLQIATSTAYGSLNQQISSLQNDKDFIKDHSIQVELDTQLIESDIGFRRIYDI
ncbi:unnamed protein product (macronuclear) [Paramecium tetraurelia]|uniref:Uncharacterized protein n=1 Tax=Paramecium tetraurelia TaxID=5888 RepID=A0CGM6_PARTE|nr:uncharacterized protein GSPATT00007383001 [Paramecium tetraurelia]CAK69943.1 unnamed protein product [Paramecium tetraurelia]|eukprot:XP_001437340.1 hypothetical protein (macronuclear) [Paramecium tetraurelia strain d4-2]